MVGTSGHPYIPSEAAASSSSYNSSQAFFAHSGRGRAATVFLGTSSAAQQAEVPQAQVCPWLRDAVIKESGSRLVASAEKPEQMTFRPDPDERLPILCRGSRGATPELPRAGERVLWTTGLVRARTQATARSALSPAVSRDSARDLPAPLSVGSAAFFQAPAAPPLMP